MTAKEQFQEVIQRINNRINELKEGNAKDLQQLEALEQQYEEAVTAFQSDKADNLHKEITGLRQNMDNRSRQIAILEREDNPTRKQAADTYLKALDDKQSEVKGKATKLKEKAQKAKQDYLNALQEVAAANKEYLSISIAYNRASNQFAGTRLNEYGTDNFIPLYQFEIKLNEIHQVAQKNGGTN